MARLSRAKLDEYIEIVRPILISVAKQKGRITYKEIIDSMDGRLGRAYVGQVIGRISDIELAAIPSRQKLSAVVVRRDTGMVGGGFFGFGDTPTAIKRSTKEEFQNPHLSGADQQYWFCELEKVYKYWREHNT